MHASRGPDVDSRSVRQPSVLQTLGHNGLSSPLSARSDGAFIVVVLSSSVSVTELMLIRRGLSTLKAESLILTAECDFRPFPSSEKQVSSDYMLHIKLPLTLLRRSVFLINNSALLMH